MGKRRDKGAERSVARERIDLLMQQARDRALSRDLELADRYVELARRLAMRYNVRLDRAYRDTMCRHCYRYLAPGISSSVRIGDRTYQTYLSWWPRARNPSV